MANSPKANSRSESEWRRLEARNGGWRLPKKCGGGGLATGSKKKKEKGLHGFLMTQWGSADHLRRRRSSGTSEPKLGGGGLAFEAVAAEL